MSSAEFGRGFGALDARDMYQSIFEGAGAALPTWLEAWLRGIPPSSFQDLQADVVRVGDNVAFRQATITEVLPFMQSRAGDTIPSSPDNDVLTGSHLADVFVFEAQASGADILVHLDRWDSLRFDGFGYASREDVLAHFTDLGDSLQFADQGARFKVLGADADLLSDVTFLY